VKPATAILLVGGIAIVALVVLRPKAPPPSGPSTASAAFQFGTKLVDAFDDDDEDGR
jgi:hypothetical protein